MTSVFNLDNPKLLKQALTHKSYAFEHPELSHNEKLEFLGDAVLDLVVSVVLMNQYPEDEEGPLSKKRASLVNEAQLAEIARELGLHHQLLLGKGESQSGGAERPRLLASALEALVGALFQEKGWDQTLALLGPMFVAKMSDKKMDVEQGQDFKSRLQELLQARGEAAPRYEVVKEIGPPHDRIFEVALYIGEQLCATTQGRSKKKAEQEGARLVIEGELLQKEKDNK